MTLRSNLYLIKKKEEATYTKKILLTIKINTQNIKIYISSYLYIYIILYIIEISESLTIFHINIIFK